MQDLLLPALHSENCAELNAHAEEIGAHAAFHALEWAGTDETAADSDRLLSTAIRFDGQGQF